MITLDTLANELQKDLNKISEFFKFNIVADTGSYKKPKREENNVTEYINGVLTSQGSEITNLIAGAGKPLIYATQSCTLRLIMSLQKPEFDEHILEDGTVCSNEELAEMPKDTKVVDSVQGWQTRLNNLRDILNKHFQGVVVDSMEEDLGENGKRTYLVSTVFSFTGSGQREQNQAVGDSYSFYINIFYSFIENGVNTRNMAFMLDGVYIPFQSVTLYRSPIMDGNVYANSGNGTAKNIATQSTFSAMFELPAFSDDKTTENIRSFIMDGELNVAHLLRFNNNGLEREYIVTLGEVKQIGETIKNIGQSLSLVEAPDNYDLISFPSSYFVYESTAEIYTVRPVFEAQTYVFNNVGFIRYITEIEGEIGDTIVSTKRLAIEEGDNLIEVGVQNG